MLRLFALLLFFANALFFAWSKNYLSPWGFAPVSSHETYRLNEQIEPERIVIKKDDAIPATTPTTPTTATPASAIAAATICLTAGAFNDRQSTVLKQTLSTELPDLNWRFDTVNVPARWIVYMGKYSNDSTRNVKKKQLDQMNVSYEVLTEGNLEPGISLGSHATQAAANQALRQLVKQGVRTARVLQELPEQKAQTLVVPAINDINRATLTTVYATMATQIDNKALQVCK